MEKIHQWAEIRDNFSRGTLFLGNGASIAVSDKCRYESIYEAACEYELLGTTVEIFRYFETKNFETVLFTLAFTNKMNEFLDIREKKLTIVIKKCKRHLYQH